MFDPCTDPFTTALIRKKVKSLISKPPFNRADQEDLYQELLATIVQCVEKIDDNVGHRNPYITAIVQRQVSAIRRRSKAVKRDHTGVASLNVLAPSGDGRSTDLISTLCVNDGDRRVYRDRRLSEQEIASLRLDLAEVVFQLPAPWQRMLELCCHHSLSEVARQMNVPRTSLCNWMQQIRAQLVAKGIHNYFQI